MTNAGTFLEVAHKFLTPRSATTGIYDFKYPVAGKGADSYENRN